MLIDGNTVFMYFENHILMLVSTVVFRAGSRGPRAPRHTIWHGPPILTTYKQQSNPFTNSFASFPRSHLIQDRI